MIVLGFDTATPASVIALRLPDGCTLSARDDPGPGERPGHSTRLLPLAADLLASADLRFSDIHRVAVGVGPGTFTGLRIGLATARGLAQSLSCEIVAVSSLRALAAGAETATHTEPHTAVLAVIDARRGEAFAAAYTYHPHPRQPPGSGPWLGPPADDRSPVELSSPRVLAPGDLGLLREEARAGADLDRWLAVGDGAVRFRQALQALAVDVPPADSPLHRIAGEEICALALHAEPQPLQDVLPAYLRRPDAEIALERATGAPA